MRELYGERQLSLHHGVVGRIRVWVNGLLVINNWTDHNTATNTSASIALAAGVRYSITVEYYERTGSATAQLQWSYPNQATQVIPASRLFQ